MEWRPIPVEMTPELDRAIKKITGVDRQESIRSKRCALCAAAVTLKSLSGFQSIEEYHNSGMCQKCQDKFFGKD
tara:strand:+ start:372 stop:593 length:222 start_codon:yes stop_codon:yes gene_type:complete